MISTTACTFIVNRVMCFISLCLKCLLKTITELKHNRTCQQHSKKASRWACDLWCWLTVVCLSVCLPDLLVTCTVHAMNFQLQISRLHNFCTLFIPLGLQLKLLERTSPKVLMQISTFFPIIATVYCPAFPFPA
jgi:hypothetical protein